MTAGFNIRMPSEADLLRYRDEACREVMDANRPRLLAALKEVQFNSFGYDPLGPEAGAGFRDPPEIPASTGREVDDDTR